MTTSKGTLIVVGTGFKAGAHCSLEAQEAIKAADIVLTATPDPVSMLWLQELNPRIERLDAFYEAGLSRTETYIKMVQCILRHVRSGAHVCAAFYGHPGVFVYPSHTAIRILREEGYGAEMLPGISAEDCLFADLGVDPGSSGCQSYEASSFLYFDYAISPSVPLVLWQVGALGDVQVTGQAVTATARKVFVDKLLRSYDAEHQVCLYEAALWRIYPPRMDWLPISAMLSAPFNSTTTLYIPAFSSVRIDAQALQALGLRESDLLVRKCIDEKLRS